MGPPTEATAGLKVSFLLEENSNRWDLDKIQSILPEYLSQIRLLRPSSVDHDDAFIWLPSKNGIYSVKTGYHIAMSILEESDPQAIDQSLVDFNWNQLIWNAIVSPKLKVFMWKIVQQAIPVSENLLRRGMLDNACCERCGELETTEDMFLHCGFAKEIWRLLPFKIPVESSDLFDFQTAFKASSDMICLPPTGIGTGPLFPWICWALWSARNFLIFENRSFTAEETVTKAIKDAREWQHAQEAEKKPTSTTRSGVSPHPEIQERDLVYSDASWIASSNRAGLGGIFLDEQGSEILRISSTEHFVTSPLMAEALAILAVLSKAVEMGFTKVTIKSDAKDLLRIINQKDSNSELHGLLADIHHTRSLLSFSSLCFISRTDNVVADAIAKNAILASSSSARPALYPDY